MKGLLKTTAAGALATLIVSGGATPLWADEQQPDSTTATFNDSCAFYGNVLRTADQNHFSGPATTAQTDMAAAAYHNMMWETYVHVVEASGPDHAAITFVDDNNRTIDTITGISIDGKTISFSAPSVPMGSYADHCAYLQPGAEQIAAATNIPVSRLFEFALNGALHSSRDPHTSYQWLEAAANNNDEIRGGFGGIGAGINYNQDKDAIEIMSLQDDMPGKKAGLLPGDLITFIDGKPVADMTPDEALAAMRGGVGEQVVMTIKRGEQEPFDVTMTRAVVILHVVKGELIGPGKETAYVRLEKFAANAFDEMVENLFRLRDEAQAAGATVKSVVFDLRDNSGGLVDQAALIADMFIQPPRGHEPAMIMATGKTAQEDQILEEDMVDGNITDIFPGVTVKVLINQGSASASEIVAGAMRDAGFEVYGVPSFGKGTVQSMMPIDEKGNRATSVNQNVVGLLSLTTDAFFAGRTGLSNQGSGVSPTVQTVYNDERDQMVADTPREEDLPRVLAIEGMDRENQTPDEVCTLKAEFAGVLTPEEAAAVPEELILNLYQRNESGEYDPVKLVDADLACAMEYGAYTLKTPAPNR